MHITEVFGDALVAERHMCMVCAQQMGLPASADITDAVHRVRKLLAFIKANNRMPTQEEFKLLRGAGGMSSPAPGAKDFRSRYPTWRRWRISLSDMDVRRPKRNCLTRFETAERKIDSVNTKIAPGAAASGGRRC